jgi:GTP-binding protein HflX
LPAFERQRAVTEEVLDEIGAGTVPRILVFDKIDRIGNEAAQQACEAALRAQHPDCIVMSARRAGDIAKLHAAIAAFFRPNLVEAEFLVPWSLQQLRGEIFRRCDVLEERAESEGAFFRVRVDAAALKRLRERLDAGPIPDV